ncbi:MAG: hypothetical protein HY263_11180 [Chloroflexi bacterium]|nr:hypothetical protein [Chloroflexota bacterium]
MTPLDDEELTTHLRHRSGEPRTARSLADQVPARIAGEHQLATRPWDRWRWPSTPSRRASGWRTAATVVSGALILVLASALIALAPLSPPAASPARTWLLTNDQLIAVARAAAGDPSNVGRAVVAEVRLARAEVDCAEPPCPAIYSLAIGYTDAGPRSLVRVDGLPESPSCPPPGSDCTVAIPTTGRMAVIIGRGRVTFLGWVRLGADDGAWSPGSLSSADADPLSLQGRLVVVDGWLTGYGGPILCPAGIPPSTGVAAREQGYACGDAAWITAQRYVSTTVSSAGVAVHPPADGVRVQNGAYEAFARAPTAQAEPRHGLYLVDVIGAVEDCFDCPSPRVGRLVARIEPIELPLEMAPASPPVSSQPSPPDAAFPDWMLTQAQLIAAVRQATLGVGVGRVVVANVIFASSGDCGGSPPAPSCYPIVAGSDPPIRLMNPPSSSCPAAWRCLMLARPYLPDGGPFALRIRGDGAVDWIDWVYTQGDGNVTWSFDGFRERLGRLSATERDAYELYVVSGAVRGAAFVTDCIPDPTSDEESYGCIGQPAWLTASSPAGSDSPWLVMAEPTNPIRLQNGSLGIATATDPTMKGLSSPEGVYVVRPVLRAPGGVCLFCSGPLAKLVARLDWLVPTSPGTPGPAASLSPAAAAARSVVERFESSRASGDWPTAWAMLGSATRAVFGSLERFGQQEADYNATGATVYQIADPVQDPSLLSADNIGTAWTDIVPATAWYVAVNHPQVEGASAGLEGLVVATGTDGHVHVWIVH